MLISHSTNYLYLPFLYINQIMPLSLRSREREDTGLNPPVLHELLEVPDFPKLSPIKVTRKQLLRVPIRTTTFAQELKRFRKAMIQVRQNMKL